jgi:hypothetical protein
MRAAKAGLFSVIFGLILSPSVLAAPLFGNPNAYLGTWSGSTSFTSGGNFSGHVEWAVFAPGDFPYAGYTPTAGELTYAYQVFVDGTSPLSTFSVLLVEPADNIGSFTDLGVVAPSSAVLTPFSDATWMFAGVPMGSSSIGLAFSSPRTPQNLLGSALDSGESALIIPLPSPGEVNVPEPGSLALLGVAFASLLVRRKSRV